MKNNLENKVKFFAQYWGVEAVRYNNYTKSMTVNFVDFIDMKNGLFLELKPLSSITDEHVIKVANIFGWKETEGDSVEEILKQGRKTVNELFEKKFTISYLALRLYFEVYDYLRSKGYALPWMGLSVEKLQEYGWIKLAE